MQKYDYTVFIGRFQPFHKGHLAVAKEALKKSEKLIIVLGSKEKPRTERNPLTYDERICLIQSALTDEENERVYITGVVDWEYNLQRWIGSVQEEVFRISHQEWKAGPTSIALIGHSKDHTSYYLSLFPTWARIDVPETPTIDATAIRKILHSGCYDPIGRIREDHEAEGETMSDLWYETLDSLYSSEGEFGTKSRYTHMIEQAENYAAYKKRWGHGPFVTADACVVQSGFILLIKRGQEDGEDLWALPGGFLNRNETLVQGMIRELREETVLKVPEPVLYGSLKKQRTYDDPWRSERARLITHTGLFELAEGPLPKVKGSDDAKEARWFTISEFLTMRNKMFEDHYSMICDILEIA